MCSSLFDSSVLFAQSSFYVEIKSTSVNNTESKNRIRTSDSKFRFYVPIQSQFVVQLFFFFYSSFFSFGLKLRIHTNKNIFTVSETMRNKLWDNKYFY